MSTRPPCSALVNLVEIIEAAYVATDPSYPGAKFGLDLIELRSPALVTPERARRYGPRGSQPDAALPTVTTATSPSRISMTTPLDFF
ncbi:MAG: hypothetical protein ACOH2Q_23945 [Rhodococcus sp. (in: high G+C Gram-positive bacteria)]